VHDAGGGVNPRSIVVTLDRRLMTFSYRHGVLSIPAARKGRFLLRVQAADFQELKNMEDVGPVLPNTRVLRTHVTIRR
jgi:hypothetical protein